MLLGNAEHRDLVIKGLMELIKQHHIECNVIAGTVTAGIPHATALANALGKPLIYIRDKAKDHGLQKRVEGILLKGQKVLLIEDLISTGGSSVSAVEGIREEGGIVEYCLSIFHYGFSEAEALFKKANCIIASILTYDVLLSTALEQNAITIKDQEVLADWRASPFTWQVRHGFAKAKEVITFTVAENEMKERICVALDVDTTKEALAIVSELSDVVGMFKVGKKLHCAACNEGVAIVPEIAKRGGKVFLDLKFHDVPATMDACKTALAKGVSIINLHVSGGKQQCIKAKEFIKLQAEKLQISMPSVIGVTELTSLNDEDLKEDGRTMTFDDLVAIRTKNAKKWGLDGIVCPANKSTQVQPLVEQPFLFITPGIEFGGEHGEGQKQLYTPDKAVKEWTNSILVIGSAILKAPNKRQRTLDIIKSMVQNK